MTYDNELTLIHHTYTKDEIGNQIAEEHRTVILCGVKSVHNNEFYKAAQIGLKPNIVFIVHAYEYSGQTAVTFEGKRYEIIRTYQKDIEEMELVAQEKVGAR